MVASGALHWLVSQTIFVVRTTLVDHGKSYFSHTYGFSLLGGILSISVFTLIVLVTYGASLWPMTIKIPCTGTCSAVVSAACHRPMEDEDASVETVQWGVLPANTAKGWTGTHCCITSFDVEEPEPGKTYN